MQNMTTATLEKRVRVLEAKIKLLEATPVRPHASVITKAAKKKLPRWLQASLDEASRGETRGPFATVKELMADLNRPGK